MVAEAAHSGGGTAHFRFAGEEGWGSSSSSSMGGGVGFLQLDCDALGQELEGLALHTKLGLPEDLLLPAAPTEPPGVVMLDATAALPLVSSASAAARADGGEGVVGATAPPPALVPQPDPSEGEGSQPAPAHAAAGDGGEGGSGQEDSEQEDLEDWLDSVL
jgi:hypothetical protein